MATTASFPSDPKAIIPEHIKGLIFDCDGTLIDTMPLHYIAWKTAMDAIHIDFSEERFYSFAGQPTVTIIETLAKEHNVACDAQVVAEAKEKLFLDNLETLEPVHSVLEIVHRERGKRKLAVASGGWQTIVRQSLAVIGIDQLFDTIVGADDVARGKPAPDVFLKAAEQLGLAPSQCLVYEDGDLGIQAAQAAGIQVIDVRPWYLPRKSA